MTASPSHDRPIVRLADGFRRLSGWRRNLTAIAAGIIASLSLPPADVLPALWIAIPMVIWLLDGVRSWKGALWVGWLFSFGFLAFSLYWLTFALFVAIDQYWWLVPFASSGLAFGLSIYFGIGTAIAWAVPHARPLARILALTGLWSLAWWVYGHALTGFPWNLPGYAWTEFPWLIQIASVIGIYGVTLLVILAPALAALTGSAYVTRAQGRQATLAGLAIVLVAAIFGAIRLPWNAVPTVPDVRLRLVQPSIQQNLKWVEGRFDDNLRQHMELSLKPADKPPTAIIWSEAAEPFPLEKHPQNAKVIGAMLKPGQLLLTGIDRDLTDENPPTFRDSIQVLNSGGDILATYDKFHYVPFGEYMPLSKWLPMIKAVAVGDIEPTPGPGPQTFRLPGLPPVGLSICNEVIFPGDVIDRKDRPEWVVDVTNDAWFGLSAGPYQHFAMMRVRAVEEGLPLANAANDGISGVVDPYGRVTARLGLGKIGVVDADLPTAIPETLYAKGGDGVFFLMAAASAIAGFSLGRRKAH